jgi:hypothetical protein
LLLNPRTYDPAHFDDETRRLLRATVDFFENRGKKALVDSYDARVWYGDFLDFAAKEGLFAAFLTPAADGAGKRWDTSATATWPASSPSSGAAPASRGRTATSSSPRTAATPRTA